MALRNARCNDKDISYFVITSLNPTVPKSITSTVTEETYTRSLNYDHSNPPLRLP